MSRIFNSRTEFDTYSAKLSRQLKKIQLNTLRACMAKAEGEMSLKNFYRQFDTAGAGVKNTVITELYTDAANYKHSVEVVLRGAITREQAELIEAHLEDGQFVIARQLGLPSPIEHFRDCYDLGENDHVYTELTDFSEGLPDNIEELHTDAAPTLPMSVGELVEKLVTIKFDEEAEMRRLGLPPFEKQADDEEHDAAYDSVRVPQPAPNGGAGKLTSTGAMLSWQPSNTYLILHFDANVDEERPVGGALYTESQLEKAEEDLYRLRKHNSSAADFFRLVKLSPVAE